VYAERDEAEDHDDSAAYAFANQDSADNVPTEMDEVAAAPVRALSSEQTERLASSTELSLDGDYTEGIDFYDDGRWGRANRTLRRFLEVADPSDSRRAVARYLVGASYHQQGQYENAERELTRFLEGYPEHEYADEALVLLEDIQLRTSPANRRYAPAPAPALDAMEAEPR
jgi:TolA-binding protein